MPKSAFFSSLEISAVRSKKAVDMSSQSVKLIELTIVPVTVGLTAKQNRNQVISKHNIYTNIYIHTYIHACICYVYAQLYIHIYITSVLLYVYKLYYECTYIHNTTGYIYVYIYVYIIIHS